MLELFTKAGWVAWPLGVCSLAVLAVVLERIWSLMRIARTEHVAFERLVFSVQNGKPARLDDPELAPSPIAGVLDSVVHLRGQPGDLIRESVDLALASQRLRFRRFLPTLATIGSTAPYLGLFGTVLGVMRSFQAMSSSGLGGEAMARGISEALSATALGLLVAIPAIVAYNYFVGWTNRLYLELQEHSAELVPFFTRVTRPGPER